MRTRGRLLITHYLALLLCTVLYWLLWVPAYRLNERFEYTDLLLSAYPTVSTALAAVLAVARALAPSLVASYLATAWLFVGLLLVLFVLYLVALATQHQVGRGVALATIVASTLVFQLVLLPTPGVFTTDLFSYAFYGQVAGRFGDSPFVATPDDYSWHPLYLLINPLWRDAPSVYGPVWIAISSLIGGTLGGNVLPEILAYRLLADVFHWLNLALLWVALRRLRPGHEPLGLALYAWNPLVVFEFAGNGHNDGAMLCFLLLGLALVARGRAWAGVAAVTLSVATKYTTVLVLPLFLWWATRPWRGWRRFLVAGLGGLAALLFVAVLYLPWWRGTATLGPIVYWLSTPLYNNHPPIGVAGWTRDLIAAAGWLDWDTADWIVLAVERQVVRLIFLGWLACEVWRLQRAADLPLACGRLVLVFLLLVNTWVLPWYYTWAVALVALGDPRSRTTWLTIALSATAPLAMYWTQAHLVGMELYGYALYLAPVAALGAYLAARRLLERLRAPAAPTTAVGGTPAAPPAPR